MNGFKSQQHRWTKGSIQTCKKLLPAIWRSELPLHIKIEATAHLTSNFAYLLLACLCVLLQPVQRRAEAWHVARHCCWTSRSSCAPRSRSAVFYICAQRELNPKGWMKEMLLMPMLLALGIGMSLNNARAVLEAMFDHQSEFTRTPKYGIEGKKQKWRSSRYTSLKSMLPSSNWGLPFILLFSLSSLRVHGQYLSLPFLILFQGGFGYVAITSLAQWLPRIPQIADGPVDAVTA